MRKPLLMSILILLAYACASDIALAQRHRRRNSRHQRPVIEKQGTIEQPSSVPTLEENAKVIESCLVSENVRPRIDTRWEFNSVLCGKAISKPVPRYPAEAKAAKVSGIVPVSIAIDEQGRVFWAQAADGHPLLREAAKKAACQARFSPTKVSGRALKTGALITYNFVLQ